MARRTRGGLAGLVAVVGASLAGPALAHEGGEVPPTLPGLLTGWAFEPAVLLSALAAAGLYLWAVRRVNAAHPATPVPRWRVVAWLVGVATVVVALASAIDLYADDLLTVHMVQHLLLALVAPPLLALGAPITLLLRAVPAGWRRGTVLPILHSRAFRVLSSPFLAWPIFSIAMIATHFTPLYEAALESPLVHDLEHVVYLAAGVIFWWPVVGADPRPRRLSHWARVAYLAIQMPVGAAVGLAIYFAPSVLYPHYALVARSWGPTPLIDQQVGGLVMWAAGDLLLLGALLLVVADWMRLDMRRSQRADRRAPGGVEPAEGPG